MNFDSHRWITFVFYSDDWGFQSTDQDKRSIRPELVFCLDCHASAAAVMAREAAEKMINEGKTRGPQS